MAVTIADIHAVLEQIGGWGSIYVPEFTFRNMRIDAAIIDIRTRWIRGFEIKMSRSDFLRDEKWMGYSEFVSSLSIVCPAELIKPDEVKSPFGLLWISESGRTDYYGRNSFVKWVKKPKRFQTRDGMAWLYQYVSVLEKEMPRLSLELVRAKNDLRREREFYNKKVGNL